MIIAWDVDDSLILPPEATGRTDGRDVPNYELIAVYRWFQSQGHRMIVWSGGGEDYARMWADKLGLEPDEVHAKGPMKDLKGNPLVDICFDDCIVDLARVNIQVRRKNNQQKRLVPKFREPYEDDKTTG